MGDVTFIPVPTPPNPGNLSSAHSGRSTTPSGPVPFSKMSIAGIITCLIIFNNTINLIILRKMTSINTRVKALMASMSASDLLLGVLVCLPGVVAAIISHWPFSSAFCQVTGLINGMSISVSMWSLTGISVERFLVVAQPVHFNHQPRLLHVRLAIVFIWAFNIIYYLVPVFTRPDMVYYVYQADVLVCGFVWEPDFMLYLAAVLYPVGPGLIIIGCSYRIVLAIRRNNLKIMDSTTYADSDSNPSSTVEGILSSSNSNTPPGQCSKGISRPQGLLQVPSLIRSSRIRPISTSTVVSQSAAMRKTTMKRETKVSKVMIITAAAFFICSFPYLCTALAEKHQVTISSWHEFGVMWLLNCNSFINVFIYSSTYAEFRMLFRRFFLPFAPGRAADIV